MKDMSNDYLLKWLALCGFVGPILDITVPMLVGIFDPGYSPVRQFISELGVPGRPYAPLISIWFAIGGLLFVAFALGLYRGLPRTRFSWVGPLLLATYGIFNGVGSGVFPCDPGCAGKTFSGQMHLTVSAIGYVSMVLVPFFVWVSIRNDRRWAGYAATTLIFQALGIGIFIWFAVVTGETSEPSSSVSIIGGVQLLLLVVYYVWFMVIAYKLLTSYLILQK
jgi:hypothetical membrane protein